ncbi:prolyl oligopeptidase family serine peptidase [Lysobacter sp. CA199]|uniref:prolyl oligopeptidase family serine peptidase n=1 Tax=Lysobacter sp. CA199 TaxID=3455608 RepID=UPI003F8D830B
MATRASLRRSDQRRPAPGQFGAAVINAGLIDTLRLLEGKNGANQIAELGDPRTAEGLKQLAAMDAHQNIVDGKRYPATMLTVGLNDQRVVRWHSGKFGARLAAAGEGRMPSGSAPMRAAATSPPRWTKVRCCGRTSMRSSNRSCGRRPGLARRVRESNGVAPDTRTAIGGAFGPDAIASRRGDLIGKRRG